MVFKQPDLGLESERQSCVLTTTPPRLVSKSVRPFFFKDSKTREESGMEQVKPQATAISYEAPDRTVSVSISCNYCHYSDLSKLKISGQIFLSGQLSWTSHKDGQSVLPAAFSMLEKIPENLLNGKSTVPRTIETIH